MRNAEMNIGEEQEPTPVDKEPPKSFYGTPPSWDDLLGPRLPKETPPSESDDSDWNNDLSIGRK
jgi:hypothetical protein